MTALMDRSPGTMEAPTPPASHPARSGETTRRTAARGTIDQRGHEPWVVIPCGGAKLDRAAPAAELYVGSYFRACLAAARSLATDDRIFVLSAKHGFVGLGDELEPYDQRIDQPGAITPMALTEIAWRIGWYETVRPRVVVLASKAYTDAARTALPKYCAIETPLAGSAGIGEQLARLKRIKNEGRLP